MLFMHLVLLLLHVIHQRLGLPSRLRNASPNLLLLLGPPWQAAADLLLQLRQRHTFALS